MIVNQDAHHHDNAEPNPSNPALAAAETDSEVFFLVKNRQAAEQLVSTLEHEEKPEIHDIRAITAIDSGQRDALEEPTQTLLRPRRATQILDLSCGVILGINLAILVSQWLPAFPYSTGGIALLGLTAAALIGAWLNRLYRDSRKRQSLAEFLPELEKGRVLVFVRVAPRFKQFVLSLSSHRLKRRLLTAGELQSEQDSVLLNSP